MTRFPIDIEDAQPMIVPLNPQSCPIFTCAVSLSVETMQGRLIPTRLDHLLDRNWQFLPIVILDPGKRRNNGSP
jgi:hypothetical protein